MENVSIQWRVMNNIYVRSAFPTNYALCSRRWPKLHRNQTFVLFYFYLFTILRRREKGKTLREGRAKFQAVRSTEVNVLHMRSFCTLSACTRLSGWRKVYSQFIDDLNPRWKVLNIVVWPT